MKTPELLPSEHSASTSVAADDPRVPLAAERTLLAWIRTGLALMGFGFVLARYDLFIHELAAARGASPSPDHLSHWVGIALVMVSVLVNVLATIRHVSFLRQLSRGSPPPPRALSLGTILSMVLAALGLLLAAYLLVRGGT